MARLKGTSLLESLVALALLSVMALILLIATQFTLNQLPDKHEQLGVSFLKGLYHTGESLHGVAFTRTSNGTEIRFSEQLIRENEEGRLLWITAKWTGTGKRTYTRSFTVFIPHDNRL